MTRPPASRYRLELLVLFLVLASALARGADEDAGEHQARSTSIAAWLSGLTPFVVAAFIVGACDKLDGYVSKDVKARLAQILRDAPSRDVLHFWRESVSAAIKRIAGSKLISVRSVIASCCCSAIAMGLVIVVRVSVDDTVTPIFTDWVMITLLFSVTILFPDFLAYLKTRVLLSRPELWKSVRIAGVTVILDLALTTGLIVVLGGAAYGLQWATFLEWPERSSWLAKIHRGISEFAHGAPQAFIGNLRPELSVFFWGSYVWILSVLVYGVGLTASRLVVSRFYRLVARVGNLEEKPFGIVGYVTGGLIVVLGILIHLVNKV